MDPFFYLRDLYHARPTPLTETELTRAQKTDKCLRWVSVLLLAFIGVSVLLGWVVACLTSAFILALEFMLYTEFVGQTIRVVPQDHCEDVLKAFQKSPERLAYLAQIHEMNRPVWTLDLQFAIQLEKLAARSQKEARQKEACKALHGVAE